MPDKSYELHGVRVFECASEGPPLRTDRDALDLISGTWEQRAALLVIPVERLSDDFFQLRTRVAGEILQKFVNYRLRVAILGDISRYLDESSALQDFVRESNRGDQIWFVQSSEDLEKRLDNLRTMSENR